MGYVGLIVGALVVTVIAPKAAAAAYRQAKSRFRPSADRRQL